MQHAGQFREIPGIMEGKGKPEYDKCVAISTDASIKKMMAPGAIAIIAPLIIGFLLGPEAIGGFLDCRLGLCAGRRQHVLISSQHGFRLGF